MPDVSWSQIRESLTSLASEQKRQPRKWQAMFIRNSGVLLGVVEAPDRRAAEAAAAEQFSLTAEELEHVLIIERLALEHVVITERLETLTSGQRRPPNRFMVWVLRAMQRSVAWVLRAMKRFVAWALPAMQRFVAWVLRAMKRFVAWALPAMQRFVAQHPVLFSALSFIGVLAFYIVASSLSWASVALPTPR